MALPERFTGPVLTNAVVYETAFSKRDFEERMRKVRLKIEKIRNDWPSNEEYMELVRQLRGFIKFQEMEPADREIVQRKVTQILGEYHDYADTQYRGNVRAQPEQYPSVELYCSQPGYKYIYSTISKVLRQPEISDDLLVTAVALVEFVTIDLYNLRLSNLGDDRYSNFQGIVYRCFRIAPEDAERYRKIVNYPDVQHRHFSIPLGLCSSSADKARAMDFLKNLEAGEEAMLWKVHIHGMDQDLLRAYLDKYPDSVVTSICAMPVARLSPFGEKEILLRGAFFQAIQMKTEIQSGYRLHVVELVTINANRDHTTERASNEGEKAVQRKVFQKMAEASRYEVSASISAQHHLIADHTRYKELQLSTLHELQFMYGFCLQRNDDLASARSQPKQAWLGGSEYSSYPSNYAQLRLEWQTTISQGNWGDALEILEKEYDWYQNDWFNVAKLSTHDHEPERPGFTFLHEFALHQKLEPCNKERAALEQLVRLISEPGIWKTVRSFDNRAITAYELAMQESNVDAAEVLRPKILHAIPENTMMQLEKQLHQLMNEKAGDHIQQHKFRLPQISVLTEMEKPELWIPIPYMYGGFAVQLHGIQLKVAVFESVPGHSQARVTERVLQARDV